jgi:hypothetical protein
MPLSWKIGAAVASLIVAMFAWNGLSQYLAARQADEITRDSARIAMQDAQLAKAQAEQHQAQLAANLRQQQDDLSSTHQQVDERARQYQAEQVVRANKQQQEDLRLLATYHLDANERCEGGIVISHSGSSFTQVVDASGQPIPCQGDMAKEPLR